MGSVQDAAEALKLTQPAISLQIQNMEKQMGFALFERSGRRNVLTSKGQILYRKLMPQLETLERTLLDVQEIHNPRPELILGSVEGVGEYWLWKSFREFSKKHKELRLLLEISESDMLQDRLATGRVTLAITPRKIEVPGLVSQVLMDETLVPVGNAQVIAKLKKTFESKADEGRVWEQVSWIGYSDLNGTDPWAGRWLEHVGVLVDRRFRFQHQANSYAVIQQLLMDGHGVCVAPKHVFEHAIENKELSVFENKKFPGLKNRMYISWREGSLNGLHQEFLDWILTVSN